MGNKEVFAAQMIQQFFETHMSVIILFTYRILITVNLSSSNNTTKVYCMIQCNKSVH